MKSFTILCVASALTLSGCKATTHNTQDDINAIREVETNWVAACKAHDVAKVVSYYADDATVMNPGDPAVTGKDNITAAFRQMLSDPSFDFSFHPDRVEVSKSGDMAWAQGVYQFTVVNPATHQPMHGHGNYVTTFQKQPDGSWKAVADIATSDVPPPAPAAPEGKTAQKH